MSKSRLLAAISASNFAGASAAAGLLVERVRAWREGRRAFSGSVFAYAALFGLAFALTRYTLIKGLF